MKTRYNSERISLKALNRNGLLTFLMIWLFICPSLLANDNIAFLGAETMRKAMDINPGGKINNQGTMIIKRRLINQSSLPDTLGMGTFEFSGSENQSIIGTYLFQNLTINNSSGISIHGNMKVNGIVTLLNGVVTLGASNLVIGPSATLEGTPGSSAMIIPGGPGELRKEFTSFPAVFTFPVGDTSGTHDYSPLTLRFSAGSIESDNYVGITLSNTKYPYDSIQGSYLKRFWNLTGYHFSDYICSLTFQYVPTDITGYESLIHCAKVNPLPVVWFDTANTTIHQLTVNGLSAFGTFTGIEMPFLPVAYYITGSGSYCQEGTGLTVTLSGSQTGVSYQLKKNGINEGAPLSGTGSPLTWPGRYAGIYTAEATNDFFTIPMNGSAVITETASVPVSVTIASNTNDVCEGTTVIFTATPINGGSSPFYQWIVNNINVGANQSSYSYIPLDNDVIRCRLTSNGTCITDNPAISNPVTMTINATPAAAGTIVGADTVVQGQMNVSYSIPVIPEATGYVWTLPPGSSISTGNNTNAILIAFSDTAYSGIIHVYGTNNCGNGTTSPDFNITVNSLVPLDLSVTGTVIQGGSECLNATRTIMVAGSGNTFIVEDGGEAIVISGKNILLLDGTVVQPGGHLLAYITTANEYCGARSPSMVNTKGMPAEINEINREGNLFMVYPNPTTGNFILEPTIDDLPDKVTVSINGMRGEKVLSAELNGHCKHTFSLSDRPAGVYFIRVISGERAEIVKIIKQ